MLMIGTHHLWIRWLEGYCWLLLLGFSEFFSFMYIYAEAIMA